MTYLDQSRCPACLTPWDKSNPRSEDQMAQIVIEEQKRGYFECPCGMQVSGYKLGVITIIRKYLGTEYVAVWTYNGSSWLYNYKMKPAPYKIEVQIPFDLTENQISFVLTFS